MYFSKLKKENGEKKRCFTWKNWNFVFEKVVAREKVKALILCFKLFPPSSTRYCRIVFYGWLKCIMH